VTAYQERRGGGSLTFEEERTICCLFYRKKGTTDNILSLSNFTLDMIQRHAKPYVRKIIGKIITI
jgi:hypothetical protein